MRGCSRQRACEGAARCPPQAPARYTRSKWLRGTQEVCQLSRSPLTDLIDELKNGGYEYDVLVLTEFRGCPQDEWFWRERCAIILQKYKEDDNHMWMALLVNDTILDMTQKYKVGDRWQYMEFGTDKGSWGIFMTHLQPTIIRERFMTPLLEAEDTIHSTTAKVIFIGDLNINMSMGYMNKLHQAKYPRKPHKTSMHTVSDARATMMKDWLIAARLQYAVTATRTTHGAAAPAAAPLTTPSCATST